VQSSRVVLLNYCDSFNPGDITRSVKEFSNASIRNLLVHVANTYLFWTAKYSLKKQIILFEQDKVRTVSEITRLYLLVDEHVKDFIDTFEDGITVSLKGKEPGGHFDLETTPLQVFTHVITHEFHHKGQIMTMSWILGYAPPDADIVRLG
jgi:uncharacterized damage-inducible protein DinB